MVLGAVLFAGAGGLARVNTSASAEPSLTSNSTTPAGDVHAQVVALLDATRTGAPSEEAWRRLGPGAVPVLSALVVDPSAPAARRTLAVASLALVDPTSGATPIRAVLEDAKAPAEVRVSAAGALGRCLGLDAIPTLITRLQDPELQVREAVAVALGRLGGQQARQALEDRLPVEERALVREALQRGLTLVEP
ncbi:HEAT repeat domain-containing protein [Corallococcus macrosporus]|uniref:PBS lyase n=1 Tax=Corallococcus macrosporus DSM 14697 TaxID=1189310 RepID=A0A250JV74_9BACT|nr:HEAT repeat domain-containing protein [Corallococcus macrosporus]ATB47397.1 PBS lyase [Corallococcus macrosporus DSM 14697]